MKKLIIRQQISDTNLIRRYNQLGELLKSLEKKKLSEETNNFINEQIESLNFVSDSEKFLLKKIKESENEILDHLEKKVNLVPKNRYRKRWLVLGIGAFGIPLGLVLSFVSGNMTLLSSGVPIGIGVGILVGSSMDKKALKDERQLEFEVKY